VHDVCAEWYQKSDAPVLNFVITSVNVHRF